MKYKTETIEKEYVRLNPKLIAKARAFEEWSLANGLPEPVATHVMRTRLEQERIYWPLIKKADPSITEQQARSAARTRFSWHLVRCALDLRDYIYTPEQMKKALEWFRENMKGPEWEFLYHDVGRGKHLHLGIRDHAWAGKFSVT